MLCVVGYVYIFVTIFLHFFLCTQYSIHMHFGARYFLFIIIFIFKQSIFFTDILVTFLLHIIFIKYNLYVLNSIDFDWKYSQFFFSVFYRLPLQFSFLVRILYCMRKENNNENCIYACEIIE